MNLANPCTCGIRNQLRKLFKAHRGALLLNKLAGDRREGDIILITGCFARAEELIFYAINVDAGVF